MQITGMQLLCGYTLTTFLTVALFQTTLPSPFQAHIRCFRSDLLLWTRSLPIRHTRTSTAVMTPFCMPKFIYMEMTHKTNLSGFVYKVEIGYQQYLVVIFYKESILICRMLLTFKSQNLTVPLFSQ